MVQARWYYYGKLLFYYHERTSLSGLGVNYGSVRFCNDGPLKVKMFGAAYLENTVMVQQTLKKISTPMNSDI